MPKQNDYTPTEEELKQVLEAVKSPIARVAKRALVLHSLHLGYPPEAIARIQALSLATVYNHFNRFKAEGIVGLADKPKQGRPPKANESYRKRSSK
jgi:transposase